MPYPVYSKAPSFLYNKSCGDASFFHLLQYFQFFTLIIKSPVFYCSILNLAPAQKLSIIRLFFLKMLIFKTFCGDRDVHFPCYVVQELQFFHKSIVVILRCFARYSIENFYFSIHVFQFSVISFPMYSIGKSSPFYLKNVKLLFFSLKNG